MTVGFDRIVIAVPELQAAMGEYGQLLGAPPFTTLNASGQTVAWWGLPNTVIELVQRPVDKACIQGIVLGSTKEGEAERDVANSLELEISVGDGQRTSEFRQQQPQSQLGELSVDHLVLRTADAEACIGLFRTAQRIIKTFWEKSSPKRKMDFILANTIRTLFSSR
jgi:hypothetical protein